MQNHLEAAYGLDALMPGSLDTDHELEPREQFVSLVARLRPAAAGRRQPGRRDGPAAEPGPGRTTFPAAPQFEAEVKSGNLKKVYDVVSEAARTEDGRVDVEKPLRPLVRQIANPLLLGEMGLDATHFVLGQHWKNHFTSKAAETGQR